MSLFVDFNKPYIYILPLPTLQISGGHVFTNKLHRMYTDMKISHDLREKFSEFVDKQVSDGEPGLGINFNILVLQDGAWPIRKSTHPSFNLPQELERSIQLVSNRNWLNCNYTVGAMR